MKKLIMIAMIAMLSQQALAVPTYDLIPNGKKSSSWMYSAQAHSGRWLLTTIVPIIEEYRLRSRAIPDSIFISTVASSPFCGVKYDATGTGKVYVAKYLPITKKCSTIK